LSLDRLNHMHPDLIRKDGGWWKVQDCQVCHLPAGDKKGDRKKHFAELTEKERNDILKKLTVRAAVHDLENVLGRLRHATPDAQTELEALDEIARIVQDMCDKAKRAKD
jgi:hypothetical protein